MHEKVYDKLGKKYSFMRRGQTLKEQHESGFVGDLYGAFGCEFGPGWYKIVEDVCKVIQKEMDNGNIESEGDRTFRISQIKEKWGGIRIYVDGGNDAVYAAIQRAEDRSFRTCEECGKRGTMYCSSPDGIGCYYRTICAKDAKRLKYVKAKSQ